MPGHFLVRHTAAPRVLIDPFHGGRMLDADQCADLFTTLFGTTATLPAVGPRRRPARGPSWPGCWPT